jgi:2-phosphoglycerate kinase
LYRRSYDHLWVVKKKFSVIYFIGGPARCGKSTLAKKIRKNFDGHVLSTDALSYALREMTQPEWLPGLFHRVIEPTSEQDPAQKRIKRLYQRDKVVWQLTRGYIEAIQHDSADDILIEGCIWPDFLTDFAYEHKAVFLIDTSVHEQTERLLLIRDGKGDNNWMKDYSNERMVTWVHFNKARSLTYKQLCNRTKYSYFDIAQEGIDGAQQRALSVLI